MTDARPVELISAVPTPFDRTGQVDERAFELLLDRIEPSVDAIFVAGTTGEFPALRHEERVRLFAVATRVVGPERVIAHVGGNGDVGAATALIDAASSMGIPRLAAIEPMFFAVDDRTVVDHFARLGDCLGSGTELFAYLFPERSGNDTSLDALLEILSLERITGVKLSGGANRHLGRLLSAGTAGKVYSGDDGKLPEVVAAGGAGIVSGCSAAFPEVFGALRDAVSQGDAECIAGAQKQAHEAIDLVGGSIAWLKAYLSDSTGSDWTSRMAMTPITAERRQMLSRAACSSTAGGR